MVVVNSGDRCYSIKYEESLEQKKCLVGITQALNNLNKKKLLLGIKMRHHLD
jgi:hypothetical protein